MDIYRPQPQATALGTRVDLRAIMREVYLWMTLGLLITAGVALFLAVSGITVALGPVLMFAPFVQIGLVWYLSARIGRMSAERATTLFLVFAAVMGVTMSSIFYWADLTSIYIALFSTGALFAAMSIVGYTTQVDLSRLGGILFMALIGLIIASVVNIFAHSSTLYWIISYAGVLIFTGLTAYDTQWIKRTALVLEARGEMSGSLTVRRLALMGALKLYLDFVNLFLYILSITSRRR